MDSYTYKRYALFVIGAFVLCYAVSVIWLFTGYHAPQPDSIWVDHLYRCKEAYAGSIRGPKIVIIAGSSGHYGISAAQMEAHFGIPAVNLSTHGDLRDYYLTRARKNINPGDLVILAPEYSQYFYNDNMSSLKADYIVNFDKVCLRNLPAAEMAGILKTYANPWKVIRNSILKSDEKNLRKNLPVLSRNGDEINNIGCKTIPDKAVRIPPVFRAKAHIIEKMNDFISWCRARHVTPLLTWPGTLPYDTIGFEDDFMDALIRYFTNKNVEILGKPRDFFVEQDDIYDTVYHLNRKGVHFRTSLLIVLLEENSKFNHWRRKMGGRISPVQQVATDPAHKDVCFNGGAERVSEKNVQGWTAVTGKEGEIWGTAEIEDVIARNGAHSFRLQNTSGGQTKWRGRRINLPPNVRRIRVEAWSRSEGMESSALYCILIRISFKDKTFSWEGKNLHFPKNSYDWVEVSSIIESDKEIAAVQPFLILYGRGTAWFDDIRILVPSGADQKLQSVAHSEAAVSDAGLMD